MRQLNYLNYTAGIKISIHIQQDKQVQAEEITQRRINWNKFYWYANLRLLIYELNLFQCIIQQQNQRDPHTQKRRETNAKL